MIRDPQKLAMRVSMFASVLMLSGKMTAYVITHSAAIFADAAESVVHGVATGFAAFSLWYAARPADQEHPYGHGRIVYFSTGFEGALVLAASITVLYSGVHGLFNPQPLTQLGTGLLISGALALINLVLGISLVRIGRQHNAIVLVANGRHVLSDFWTTAGAILGLGLVWGTGVRWLDPLAAILIGGWIMYTGVTLMRESYSGLMDRVDAPLRETVENGLKWALETKTITDYHELRCRRLNDAIFIDVHLLLPGDTPLTDAHRRATRVENELRMLFPKEKVRVVTHVEPLEHDDAHPEGHPHRFDEAESQV